MLPALTSTTKILCDNFNTDHLLEVLAVSGHDMNIRTLSINPMKSGPGARIYHGMGSSSDHHVALFAYFTAMTEKYGSMRFPSFDQQQFAFDQKTVNLKKSIEIRFRDTPENGYHVRVIRTPRYLGFQTLTDTEYYKDAGPIVWFDKKLPGVRKETKAVDAMVREYSKYRHLEVAP